MRSDWWLKKMVDIFTILPLRVNDANINWHLHDVCLHLFCHLYAINRTSFGMKRIKLNWSKNLWFRTTRPHTIQSLNWRMKTWGAVRKVKVIIEQRNKKSMQSLQVWKKYIVYHSLWHVCLSSFPDLNGYCIFLHKSRASLVRDYLIVNVFTFYAFKFVTLFLCPSRSKLSSSHWTSKFITAFIDSNHGERSWTIQSVSYSDIIFPWFEFLDLLYPV
jgi:hypothetical protein